MNDKPDQDKYSFDEPEPKRDSHPLAELEWGGHTLKVKKKNEESNRKPFSPRLLMLITIIGTPLISVPLIAMNWQRFKKPKSWTWMTLGFGIAIPVGAFLLVLLIVNVEQAFALNVRVIWLINLFVGMLGVLATFYFPLIIATSQIHPYKLIQEDKSQEAYQHLYPWKQGIRNGIIIIIMVTVFAYGVSVTRGRAYSNDTARVSFLPHGWFVQTNDYIREDCEYLFDECVIAVADTNANSILYFSTGLHLELDFASDDSDVLTNFYWDWVSNSPDHIPVERDDLMIDSEKAYVLKYIGFDRFYTAVITHKNDAPLLVFVDSVSEELINNNWSDILKMIENFEFVTSE